MLGRGGSSSRIIRSNSSSAASRIRFRSKGALPVSNSYHAVIDLFDLAAILSDLDRVCFLDVAEEI